MAPGIRVRIVLLVVLAAGALGGQRLAAPDRGPALRADLKRVPLEMDGYLGREDVIDARTLDVLQATQTLNREYLKGDGRYWIFLGYFARQRFGSQIHSPRHCYPGSGWNILEAGRGRRLGDGTGELLIQQGRERRVVLYQYLTRGGATPSELKLKLDLARNSMLGRPRDAAFVRYSTAVGLEESVPDAFLRLERFARAFESPVHEVLPF